MYANMYISYMKHLGNVNLKYSIQNHFPAHVKQRSSQGDRVAHTGWILEGEAKKLIANDF